MDNVIAEGGEGKTTAGQLIAGCDTADFAMAQIIGGTQSTQCADSPTFLPYSIVNIKLHEFLQGRSTEILVANDIVRNALNALIKVGVFWRQEEGVFTNQSANTELLRQLLENKEVRIVAAVHANNVNFVGVNDDAALRFDMLQECKNAEDAYNRLWNAFGVFVYNVKPEETDASICEMAFKDGSVISSEISLINGKAFQWNRSMSTGWIFRGMPYLKMFESAPVGPQAYSSKAREGRFKMELHTKDDEHKPITSSWAQITATIQASEPDEADSSLGFSDRKTVTKDTVVIVDSLTYSDKGIDFSRRMILAPAINTTYGMSNAWVDSGNGYRLLSNTDNDGQMPTFPTGIPGPYLYAMTRKTISRVKVTNVPYFDKEAIKTGELSMKGCTDGIVYTKSLAKNVDQSDATVAKVISMVYAVMLPILPSDSRDLDEGTIDTIIQECERQYGYRPRRAVVSLIHALKFPSRAAYWKDMGVIYAETRVSASGRSGVAYPVADETGRVYSEGANYSIFRCSLSPSQLGAAIGLENAETALGSPVVKQLLQMYADQLILSSDQLAHIKKLNPSMVFDSKRDATGAVSSFANMFLALGRHSEWPYYETDGVHLIPVRAKDCRNDRSFTRRDFVEGAASTKDKKTQEILALQKAMYGSADLNPKDI